MAQQSDVDVVALPLLLSTFCFVFVAGHGSLVMPPPRNAIDSELPAWHDRDELPMTGWIQPYSCQCTNGSKAFCNAGQSCFWFSQGCTIGCSKCDGLGARIPKWDHCPMESIKPTVNDPKYRSMNQRAIPGSPQDIFFFNPWRAPGKAPVFDACGKAGGSDTKVFAAGAYNATIYVRQGDLGSQVLAPRPSGTVWTAGSVERAQWQHTALHGGGYQYRLCPIGHPLTEECFQQMPLRFAEPAGHNAVYPNKTLRIDGTLVPDSITGTGDWMRNPIPEYASDNVSCMRALPEDEHCSYCCPGCHAPTYAADGACPCKCGEAYPQYFPPGSSSYVGADRELFPDPLAPFGEDSSKMHQYVIEDYVIVPADIEPGDYVLGWRWDSEQTTQVWSSCADITIVAASSSSELRAAKRKTVRKKE